MFTQISVEDTASVFRVKMENEQENCGTDIVMVI
jgi:hypothetical protein